VSSAQFTRYSGYSQDRFVVRASIGGRSDGLVLAGSTDGTLHVWDKRSTKMVSQIQAHTGHVGAVAWSPVDASRFVSAGDDGAVHLWGNAPP
jgi:WD40 repeat protein